MKEKYFRLRDAGLCWEDLWLMSGNRGFEPDSTVSGLLEQLRSDAEEICRPSWCYEIYDSIECGRDFLAAGGGTLHCGPVIAPFLGDADRLVVYTATAGREYAGYCRSIEESGDVALAYFADMAGSAIAECAAEMLVDEIDALCGSLGMKRSNTYSPGNCGWDVSDQHNLFALLPDSPCGISLMPSGLMVPDKSVSGIIALGKDMERRPSRCALCKRTDCHRRLYNRRISRINR